MTKQNMPTKAAAAVVALLACALLLPNRDAFALDCHIGGTGKAVSSSSGLRRQVGLTCIDLMVKLFA